MKHFVFYKGKAPVIAVPVGAGLKVAFISVGCFPSHTFIRKAFKIYMLLRISLYFFVPLKSGKIDNLLKEWFERSQVSKGLYPVFIWSLVDGRERYYVHLLDKKGNKRYFAKITAKKDNYQLLENEKNSLEYFLNAKTFSVPKIVHFTKGNLYCSLITEYIGIGYSLSHPESNTFPGKISNEISGEVQNLLVDEVIDRNSIKKQNTLNDYIKSLDKDILVKVVRVHGDFGSENIFKNSVGKYLIIDWERSKDKSPYLVDQIAFWLGKNHRLVKENSKITYADFRHDFEEYSDIDIALGLYFLNSAEFNLAELISNNWTK